MDLRLKTGTTKTDDRWGYIDVIEFLGILFVMLYHSATYKYSFLSDHTAVSYIRYFLRTILATCVPLFFFANGYLLLNRPFTLKKHIFRSLKLVALTFIWGFITVILLMPIDRVHLSVGEIIKYVIAFQPGWINYLWYMGALICVYVFYPLIKKAFDTDSHIFTYFLVLTAILTFGNTLLNLAGSAALICLGLSENILYLNWFNMFNPFRGLYGFAFTYFCLGGLAHKYKERIEAVNAAKRNLLAVCAIISSCILLFVLGILFSNSTGEIWDVVWNGYDTIPTAINVLSIYVLSLNYKGNHRLLRSISSNTLGIYFIHVIFVHLLKPIVTKYAFMCTFTGSVFLALVTLLISFISVLIMKRIPCLKNLVKV